MRKTFKRVVVVLVMTFVMIMVFEKYTNYNVGVLKGMFVSEKDANLYIESVEIPEEATEFANKNVGRLLADVFGNEKGYDVDFDNYSDITLGQPFTVLTNTENKDQIYSYPVIEGDEIKMVLSVFKSNGQWSASLGKEYAKELNNLKNESDEKYVLYVQDGDIYAQNSKDDKKLIQDINYAYDAKERADFDEGFSFDDIVSAVEEFNKGGHLDVSQILDSKISSGDLINEISEYSPEFEEYIKEWQKWSDSWFNMWLDEPEIPTAEGNWGGDSYNNWESEGWILDDEDYWQDEGVKNVSDNSDYKGGENWALVWPKWIDEFFNNDDWGSNDMWPKSNDKRKNQPKEKPQPKNQPSDVNPQPFLPKDDKSSDKGKDKGESQDKTPSRAGNGIGALSDEPFKVNSNYKKILNTKGCTVNQQDKSGRERGLCWAASAATIINYIKGDGSLKGYTIADKMGIGYDTGGTIEDIYKALNNYGIKGYTMVEKQTSMNTVEKCISNKKPMSLCAYSSGGGHAVTIVGYSRNNGDTITIWNSGNQQMQTCTYQSRGTTFSYGGYKFLWYATVYPK